MRLSKRRGCHRKRQANAETSLSINHGRVAGMQKAGGGRQTGSNHRAENKNNCRISIVAIRLRRDDQQKLGQLFSARC